MLPLLALRPQSTSVNPWLAEYRRELLDAQKRCAEGDGAAVQRLQQLVDRLRRRVEEVKDTNEDLRDELDATKDDLDATKDDLDYALEEIVERLRELESALDRERKLRSERV